MDIFGKKIAVGKAQIRVPRDMVWCFEQGTFYESNVIYWLKKVFDKRGDHVFYDVGANIGYYAVLAAQQAAKVYAFEPVRKTFKTLSGNVHRNRFANVELFQIGLSDENGTRVIHVYSSSGNNSIYKRALPPGHALRWMRTEEIQLARADDLVAAKRLLKHTIIKVDVEGAELPMLRGASGLIATARPILFMELSENTFRDAGYTSADLLAELRRHDYFILGLSEDVEDLMLYPIGAETVIANIIAFPDAASVPGEISNAAKHE